METTVACSAHQSLLSHLQVEVLGREKKGWQMCVHRGEGAMKGAIQEDLVLTHGRRGRSRHETSKCGICTLFDINNQERRRARAGRWGSVEGPNFTPLSKTLTTNCSLTTLYVGLYVCSCFQQERLQRCLSDTWNGPQPSGGEAPRDGRKIDRRRLRDDRGSGNTLTLSCEILDDFTSSDEWKGKTYLQSFDFCAERLTFTCLFEG